jgi:glycosyltransferase involved in cell wall biosynthesis/peptidoglycan/xylan/chitin deacetylase (PgdA/CDA1 family)
LILGYHRVLPDSAAVPPRGVPSMGIRVSTLEQHLDFVGRRFRFVGLDELGTAVEAGAARGLAAVTFDDGYVDFYERAFPLLQRKGIPATVFVVTSLLESAGGFLHDRVYAALERALGRWGAELVSALLAERGFPVTRLPEGAFPATRALLRSLDQETLIGICAVLETEFGVGFAAPRSLTWDEVVRMSRAGLTVGSHTRTHTLLNRATPARVREETAAARADIETRLGVSVLHFAYPDGCFDAPAVAAVADAGYRYAYTGCRHRDADHPLLTLSRRVLWEGSTLGTLGGFSAAVLGAQLSGIFDLGGRCSDDHAAGALPPRPTTAVAVVAPCLDDLGGQSIQAAALVAGLRDDGFEVVPVATNPRFPTGLRWLRRVPIARTLLNQALYALELRRLRRADVVHVFAASYWSFLLAPAPAMLLARALGKPIVLNYHSGEAGDHLGRWPFVHPWLRLAQQIVVPSRYLQRVFAQHGYSARVVPNVVDTVRFAFRARSPLQPRLLSTRSLEPHYRVDVILSAFALLRLERPDATLTVAGSGSEEGRLRQQARSIPGVTFVGRVSPEAMPRLCDGADVFLNASVVDNQPLSLLEAFASGLPTVTTATGGIAGMLRPGETGIVVPPLDPAAMAAAVLALLRDDVLAVRIARGARRTAESHCWAAVGEAWAEVYAGRRGDAPPVVGDEDWRGGRQEPPGSLEISREDGYEEPASAPAR